ncbi:TRAP transporter large permease [Oceanospirillum linum]|uniref:TRAP transporter large permease protein n=1 Tax=Oceanospirillum linum TaxID=966 RepID=A0A1T1H947_OCELI|nr:TRAP transporter large permease [Oceanospirillum linum]OOV86394.1 C4-dicarboxylate ABC transporter permease [Oceanospirillum linum]SEG32101.1 TRAP transporter, DctM subunit [Oleiphilus messinensis]SMP28613.1 TRAP transporter, DctM subunit [Oceanospirillum linum]
MALLAVFLLILLMAIGVPIAWSFAAVLGYLVMVFDVRTTTLLLQGFRSLDHIILLALPLFVLTGYLMKSGGIARRLVDFIELIVMGRKGGMGASMVLASGVFGAISGTATAAVASIGTIMIGPLAKRGYPRGYSSALLGMSSLLGILIPPSITLILFGVVTRQSITALFAATIGPGLLLIIGLILFNRICAGRLFKEEMANFKTGKGRSARSITLSALPALSMPFIILGGIYGGIFTPTEAASVAVVAAIIIGFFIYKDLTLSNLKESVVNAAETTGTIILILLFSFMIGRILTAERVPQELTEAMTTLVQNPMMILLLVNVFLIFAGAIMDDLSVTVVIAPLFMPLMIEVGVDPVHFASIVACSVVIGANSPPVAPILYMACRIGKVSIHKSIMPALYLIGFVGIPVMLMVTFIPELSLYIPRLLGVL